MRCHYFDAGRCRSCSLMGVPYRTQLAQKQAHCVAVLGPVVRPSAWLEPQPSLESGFRNKAKLVVGGRPGSVTLGILDRANRGVDLRRCGLYEEAIAASMEPLASFVESSRLQPYDVPARRGELKHVIVTGSTEGRLMVRLVLRSRRHTDALRDALPGLLAVLPAVVVASVNLQPEHKAVLTGDVEIPLTDNQILPMRVNDIQLALRPGSFFQTNTAVAAALYRQAQDWMSSRVPRSVWDLYCGVGGFALHAAQAGASDVLGIEVEPHAVTSARASAAAMGLPADFRVGDAGMAQDLPPPDLAILNPPRRGIGVELARWLEDSATRRVIYSSCNPATLARDLALMPSLRPDAARLFDMFPQTNHHEVMVHLSRR